MKDPIEESMAAFSEQFNQKSGNRTPVGRYDDFINESSSRHGVDAELIKRVMGQESGGEKNARSWAGASGLMQLMPGTAKRFGVTDIKDPRQNIEGGTKYLKFLLDRYDGDVERSLAGYNAGEGRADDPKWREKSKTWSNNPSRKGNTTYDYFNKILKGYKGGSRASAIDPIDASMQSFAQSFRDRAGGDIDPIDASMDAFAQNYQQQPTQPNIEQNLNDISAQLQKDRAAAVARNDAAMVAQIDDSIAKLSKSQQALPQGGTSPTNPFPIAAPVGVADGGNAAFEATPTYTAVNLSPEQNQAVRDAFTEHHRQALAGQAPVMSFDEFRQKFIQGMNLANGEQPPPPPPPDPSLAGKELQMPNLQNPGVTGDIYEPESYAKATQREVGELGKIGDAASKGEQFRSNDALQDAGFLEWASQNNENLAQLDNAMIGRYNAYQSSRMKMADGSSIETPQLEADSAENEYKAYLEYAKAEKIQPMTFEQFQSNIAQADTEGFGKGASATGYQTKLEQAQPASQPTQRQQGSRPVLGGMGGQAPQAQQPAQTVQGVEAAVEWAEGGDAYEQALDKAASSLSGQTGIDYDLIRQKLTQNLRGGKGNAIEFSREIAESKRKAREPLTIGLDANAVNELRQAQQDLAIRNREREAIKAEYQGVGETDNALAEVMAERDLAQNDIQAIAQRGGNTIDAQKRLNKLDAAIIAYQAAAKEETVRKKQWEEDTGFLGLTSNETDAKIKAVVGRGFGIQSKMSAPMSSPTDWGTASENLQQAKQALLNEYGSFTKWANKQDELREKYKDSGNLALFKTGEAVVGGAAKAPIQGVGAVLKTLAIGSEALDRVLGDETSEASKKTLYKIGQDIDKVAEEYVKIDPDFKNGKAETFGQVLGQVGTQALLGALTGGAAAPALLGLSMGAAEQYDQASKAGSTGWERLGAAGVGGVLAASDALIMKGWFKGASYLDKIKAYKAIKDTVKANLVKNGILKAEAETVAKQFTDGFVRRQLNLGKEGLKEAAQESVLEAKGNDLYAYMTYDNTPERWKQLTSYTDENLTEGVAGFIGGVFGAKIGQLAERVESLSDDDVVSAANVLNDLDDVPPRITKLLTEEAESRGLEMTKGKDGVYRLKGRGLQDGSRNLPGDGLLQRPKQLPENTPTRINEADEALRRRLSLDTRTQKVVDLIADGQPTTVEDIAKTTKFNQKNIRNVIDGLYQAKVIQINPDDTIQLIGDINAVRPKPLYEQYDETGKIQQDDVPQQASPKIPSRNVSPAKADTSTVQENVVVPIAQSAIDPQGMEQQRRDDGKYDLDSVTYVRQEPFADSVKGNEVDVQFASSEPTTKARWAVIDDTQLQPAHIDGTPNRANFIPEAQPNIRTDDVSKYSADEIARNFDISRDVDSSNPYFGSPTVNTRGEVIQGNKRSDAIKKRPDGVVAKNKQWLIENAEKFGLSPEQINSLKRPTLVKVADVSDADAIKLGQYQASDLESGGRNTLSDPIRTAKKVPHVDKSTILQDVFLNASEDESLTDLIRENGNVIAKHLKGHLSPDEYQTLFGKGKLSPKGVENIKEIFQGFLFSEAGNDLPAQFEAMPHHAKQGLTQSLPAIFSVPENVSLVTETQNAIKAVHAFRESGVENIDNWLDQKDMFKDGKSPNEVLTPLEVELTKRLNAAKRQSDIKEIYQEYAALVNGRDADLFGDATPGVSKAEAVREMFGVEYAGDEKAVAKNIPVSAPKEQKASTPPRPTIHGMPVGEMTPLMEARVLYAKEQGKADSDIAELYNLTPQQVAEVGTLPKVGDMGQISYKLRQAMIPAKLATATEINEKVNFINDVAAELNISDARVGRTTSPTDIAAAANTVLRTIAGEFNKERSSEIPVHGWLHWLDVHGKSLSLESVQKVVDALAHYRDHYELKVEPFTNDVNLGKLVQGLQDDFGLENIESLEDVPSPVRKQILSIGNQYGLKRTATIRAFDATFLDFAEEKSTQGADLGRRERNSGSVKTAQSDESRLSRGQDSGRTADQITRELSSQRGTFGKAVKQLLDDGRVVIKDNPPKNLPSDTAGKFNGNTTTLYASNIAEGQAVPVLMHEVASHAGMKNLIGDKAYDSLSKQIIELAETNGTAKAALNRVDEAGAKPNSKEYNDEVIAYFVEEAAKAETDKTGLRYKAMDLYVKIKAALSAGLNRIFNTDIFTPTKLTPEYVTELAKGAVKRYAKQNSTQAEMRDLFSRNPDKVKTVPAMPSDADIEAEVKRQMDQVVEVRDEKGRLLAPNGKPSNLNALQWKQVRTENFKKFFGDWELERNAIDSIIAKDGKVDYEKAKQIAGGIVSGSIETNDEQRQQAQVRGGRRNVEAAVILEANERANPTASRGGERFISIAKQQELLEKYAKDQGIWQNEDSLKEGYISSGKESRVYGADDATVRKFTNPNNINRGTTPLEHLGNIDSFNAVFPETAYTIDGFAKGRDGQFKFVSSQPFITGRMATPSEIEQMMLDKGFEKVDAETFKNDNYSVYDLAPRNVVFDEISGRAFAVDANVEYHNNTPLELNANASKVVDENGEPMVVSHSTNKSFEAFKNKQENDSGWLGAGYYFFGDRSLDGQYGSNVMEVFLNVRDPYYITNDEANDLSERDDAVESSVFSDGLRGEGYDGVYYNGDLNKEWVAFQPNQIKSATANRGTFDLNEDSIRKMVAWHGSPHQFDRFSTEHIGSGEGAQVYGWGLYFASREEVADHYKRALTARAARQQYHPVDFLRAVTYQGLTGEEIEKRDGIEARFVFDRIVQRPLDGNVDIADAIREEIERQEKDSEYRRNLLKDPGMLDTQHLRRQIRLNNKQIRWLKNLNPKNFAFPVSGAKYRVDLKPAEDEYLLWDKPLSEQSEKVKKALASLGYQDKQAEQRAFDDALLDALQGDGSNTLPKQPSNPLGEDIYKHLPIPDRSDIRASEHLKSLGIRGVKYLDGSSRNKGEGDYNYVIFDEADVEVLEIMRQMALANVRNSAFYSQVERIIEQKMPNKASSEQIKGILSPNNGIKKEELDWLDLDSFFADNPKPSKQEVLDYVRANNVQVEEVVKGGRTPKENDARFEALEAIPSAERTDAENEEMESIARGDWRKTQTKFSQHVLPGGENYKELLLTMPSSGDQYKSSHWSEPNVLAHVRYDDRDGGKTMHIAEIQSDWHQDGRKKGYRGDKYTPVSELPQDYAVEKVRDARLSGKTRELPADATVSDWGGTVLIHIGREVVGEGHTKEDAIKNAIDVLYSPDYKVTDGSGNVVVQHARSREDATRYALNLVNMNLERAWREGVPGAPFKTSWPLMAFKRALRHAVENGYERVTWDTGETNADRYDLSRQVDKIAVNRHPDVFEVKIYLAGHPSPMLLDVDSSGLVIGSRDDQFKNKPLEEVIGKEVAEKVLTVEEQSTIEGNDLKVGGQGMIGFYDKILPKEVNKYVKKWGSRVTLSRVNAPKPQDATNVVIVPTYNLTDLPSRMAFAKQTDRGLNIELEFGLGESGKVQGSRANADFFSDLDQWQARGDKFASKVPVPVFMTVMGRVRAMVHNLEIAKAVVRLIPVDVMDDLVGQKGATEMLLHDPTMLADYLIPNADSDVSLVQRKALSSVVGDPTFPVTEVVLGSNNFVDRASDARPTGDTGNGFYGFSTHDLVTSISRQSERWKSTPAWQLTITDAMRESVMQGQPLFNQANVRTTRMLKRLRNSPNEALARGAVLDLGTDGVLRGNIAAAALWHNIVGTNENLLGFYADTELATAMQEFFGHQLNRYDDENIKAFLDRLIEAIEITGDVTFYVDSPLSPEYSQRTKEEEMSHRAIGRSGIRSDFTVEVAETPSIKKSIETLNKIGYDKASLTNKLDEVFAKSLRDDATKELGITHSERAEIWDTLITILEQANAFDVFIQFSPNQQFNEYAHKYRKSSIETSQGRQQGSVAGDTQNQQGIRQGRSDNSESDGSLSRNGESAGLQRGGVSETDRKRTRRRKYSELTKKERHEIQELSKKIADMTLLFNKGEALSEAEVEVLNHLADNSPSTWKEVISNSRRAGLLTSFRTHLRNMTSTGLNIAGEGVSSPIAVVADMVASASTGERSVAMINPATVMRSFKSVFKQDETLKNLDRESGISRAWNIIKHGDVKELEKSQLRELRSGSKILDAYVNGVFRLLGAEDALFKAYAFRSALEEQARVIAMNDKTKTAQSLLANPTNEMIAEAMLQADYLTFTNNNALSDAITDIKNKNEWVRFGAELVMPFDRTPTNIVMRTLEYTPVGFAVAAKHLSDRKKGSSYYSKELEKHLRDTTVEQGGGEPVDTSAYNEELADIDAAIANAKTDAERNLYYQQRAEVMQEMAQKGGGQKLSKEDIDAISDAIEKVFPRTQQAQFARTFGRAGLGSAAIVAGWALAQSGLLSGIWDWDDKDEKDKYYANRDKGVLNGSLVVGDRRYQINDTPLGKVMVLGASLSERYYSKPKKSQNMLGKTVSDVADVSSGIIMEQPLLNTAKDYLGRKISPEKRVSNLIGSFVPTLVGDVAEVTDDSTKSRRNNQLQDGFMRRTPGLRNYVPETKYAREKYMQDLTNRIVSRFDPFASRPVEQSQPEQPKQRSSRQR